jgi:hypothetical protein
MTKSDFSGFVQETLFGRSSDFSCPPKVAGVERVRVLNSEGVEILNWGALGLRRRKRI